MENITIDEIVADCIKTTRISYVGGGGFFKGKILSINHLQLGNSKFLHNPILLVLELIYQYFKIVRNFLSRFKQFLFPRPAKLWRNRSDASLVGKIVHASFPENLIPIHNLRVEFWGRTRWLQWRKLSEGFTSDVGEFILPFDVRMARSWTMGKLQFEVYQTSHVYFNSNKPAPVLERCYVEEVPSSNLTGMRYNLRIIRLHLWEYRTDTKLPRAEIANVDTDSPQYYAQGRVDALLQQIMPLELIKFKHLEQIRLAPETISLSEIQSDYPENLTVCIEKRIPGYTRSDEWFGKRMMNGMNRGSFLPDKKNKDYFWMKYFGICNYDHTNEYALPTIAIKFKLGKEELPLPVEIHVTGPTNAYDKNPWQKKIFTPKSGNDWLYAKRVARVTGSFSTGVDEHFTGTHLNAEQYAVAAYRNFRQSPLACLLFPHLKEVVLVNHSADKLLIHGYIPSATALTESGLHARTLDILGMQDWKRFRPMKAINKTHTCAQAESLFWEIVNEYVNIFFEENIEEIENHWHEVYRFSKDLVEHAVPVFTSDIDWKRLSTEEKKLAEDRLEYYSFMYSFNPRDKREKINGELKVVSPITKATSFEEATSEDLENIKQVCRYIIMITTYLHTWINEHQYDDLGEVLYSSGGLRFGNQKRGIFAPETDLSISPDLSRSSTMLWFTNFLSRTEYGFITKNEEGDVNPLFIKMLLDKKVNFDALGVDVDSIESRTNI